jgi:hypothetical protein
MGLVLGMSRRGTGAPQKMGHQQNLAGELSGTDGQFPERIQRIGASEKI